MPRRVRSVLLAAALLLAPCAPLAAQGGVTVEQSLRANEQFAEQAREALTRLTERERALHGDLAAIEDELDALRERIVRHETQLAALDRDLAAARDEHRALTRDQSRAYAELGELIGSLWPLLVADLHARSAGAHGWEEADRRFTWGATLYAEARRALAAIESRGESIRVNIARRERLRDEAERKLREVNTGKDAILAKRIEFVRRIREVRAERINSEQALDQLLAAIEQLQYRLEREQGGSFESAKGRLPHPVRGERLPHSAVAGGGVSGGGGRDGVGYSTGEGEPVRAVFHGRVVHDALLRGFGRVVILSHGDNWYSLYAYLAESTVSVGGEIDGDEEVGIAGHYPAAKGSGLYFELRSGQKAINPEEWFADDR